MKKKHYIQLFLQVSLQQESLQDFQFLQKQHKKIHQQEIPHSSRLYWKTPALLFNREVSMNWTQ